MKSHVPVMVSIAQVLLAVGWALLIGNLVFQALKSMAVGLGFEGEDPKLLFTRTFVFAFLLMASPQICEVGLSLTARIMYHACKNAGTLNKDYGTVSTMPEIPGLMLWKSGHAGVYIGGGYAIEAMGTSKGVVKTKVSDRNWQGWGKLPYIDYREGN